MDRAVVGMQAISPENGMTNDHWPEVMTGRAVIQMAGELIVVADHTKFGHVASALIAPIERVSTLVTDGETDPMALEHLHRLGVRVIVAPANGTTG